MRKKLKKTDFDSFRPSEYMRARRPELFSDSKLIEEPRLSRQVFEYHLETLTSRKEEYVFEHFCRRLAEKELCPNLLPQTGPTAGGDSKTDTETYPVADEIALRWYEGINREAAQERWAFAISTQKTWKPKVRGDVKKIIQTDRDYNLVYFISNQLIPDKDRAALEDELSEKYKISVRILDRNWIMKCVFENNRQQLAIETLGLTHYEKKSYRSLGPQDTLKETELQELEKNIEDVNRYKGVEYQLAEDCMHSAIIARNLERPRTEVDGRFDRAEMIAEKVGYRQQRMRIAYMRMWTMYFWFDDFNELNKGYGRVEKFVLGSEQTEDIEKLFNLWMLLATTVKLGHLNVEEVKLDSRKATLETELDRLASEKGRPNNALLARTNRLLLNLHGSLNNSENINNILDELAKIIDENKNNIGYPVDFLLQIIQELGELIPNNSKLDQLIEFVIELAGNREGKASAGYMFIGRGYQKLRQNMKYDAIRLFGRAQENLTMNEYLEEFSASLIGCALAYESAGLLWAARRNVLAVANQLLYHFWKQGEYISGTLSSIQKLVWLELQLGRVPYVLSWMDTALFVANKLALPGAEQKQFKEDRQIQDLILGLLFLKTELWELKWLDFFPSVLDSVGLVHSWMALLYALGYEDYLREENVIPSNQNSAEVLDFFFEWFKQPAANDLPDNPELLRESEVTFDSYIIGCHIKVEAANDFNSICLGETILAVFEAFLATGLNDNIIPFCPELLLRIKPSELVNGIPEYKLTETEGITKIEIHHTPNMGNRSNEQRSDYIEWLREIMIFMMCQIAVLHDPERTFDRMAREGAAFSRALSIVDIDVCIKNILGDNPKYCLWAWKNVRNKKTFPLRRNTPWNESQHQKPKKASIDIHIPNVRDDEWFGKISGIDNLKHREIQVHSIINIPLWNKAGWAAMAYVCPPNELPGIAIGFTNSEAGQAIFKAWRAHLGEVDENEYIRVSIIKGIDNSRPLRYSVVIGIDPEYLKIHSSKTFSIMVNRVHRMDPFTNQNLEQFLAFYKKRNSYMLLPAHYKNTTSLPEIFPKLSIKKRKLRICDAWQLDEHDLDICALQPGVKPIIPNDIKDAPVYRAIKRIEELTKKHACR